MSAIRSRANITTELAMVAILRQLRITGWRRHPGNVYGSPDFIFSKSKTAVFIDGCFWHGCQSHGIMPKSNAEFWLKKLTANKKRDKAVKKELKSRGWTVVRIWEHSLKDRALIRLKLAKCSIYGKITF